MRSRYNAVYVVTPAGSVSGGPEALHQLVDAIRRFGGQAHINYVDGDGTSTVPSDFAGYDVEPKPVVDEPGNLVVVPEIYTAKLPSVRQATTAVWWLSIDNFFSPYLGDDHFRAEVAAHDARTDDGWNGERPTWSRLRQSLNFSQSAYATEFLHARGILPAPLGDYLHTRFLDEPGRPIRRRNRIAFNPLKGEEYTARLRELFRKAEWVPLIGMSREGVLDVLRSSKLYVDFGHHPGRDRLPREAALCGACVMTGRRGSAAFREDVGLAAPYRLDERSPHFHRLFYLIASSIMRLYSLHNLMQASYRREVARGRETFDAQVRSIFFH